MAYAVFYLNEPSAPKPNRPVRYGVNVLLTWQGKLLLEYRRDSDLWGLIGGGIRGAEPEERAALREIREETGLCLPRASLKKLRVFAEPSRIVAYRDGTVHRMVTVLYEAALEDEPRLRISRESRQLRFFAPEELEAIPMAPTHLPMVQLFAEAGRKNGTNPGNNGGSYI